MTSLPALGVGVGVAVGVRVGVGVGVRVAVGVPGSGTMRAANASEVPPALLG